MTGHTHDDARQDSTSQRSAGPRWDPRIAVLSRPDGRLQLGWTPGRAVLLTLPVGVDDRTVKSILRKMDGSRSRANILWEASRRGIPTSVTEELLEQLADSGFVHTARRSVSSTLPAEAPRRSGFTVSVRSLTPSSAHWSPAGSARVARAGIATPTSCARGTNNWWS
ncbi:hypothetical protein [Rhodococcus qingshengii]|nr:hypothetical protein [Rhodococcus qingshengii]